MMKKVIIQAIIISPISMVTATTFTMETMGIMSIQEGLTPTQKNSN